MDANQVLESNDKKHRPFIENFSSNNNGIMHACGHDGHMAIGLTFARLLSNNLDKFGGTVRLIFQPAEEGVRGGACMIKTVSDVDYLFSGHIGINANDNDMIIVSADGFRTTTKFDLTIFTKNLGHSSLNSSKNDNVLMCSSKIALLLGEIKGNNKFGIVNVGVINCGTARNVIPSVAKIEFETRADDKETNDYLISQINKIIAEITNEFNATFPHNKMILGLKTSNCASKYSRQANFSSSRGSLFSGGRHFNVLQIYTCSLRENPTEAKILSNNCPAFPTNGRPFTSSQ